MSFESLKNTAESQLNPLDFAAAFYDTAVEQPLQAVRQLADKQVPDSTRQNESLAAKAGSMLGFVVDFTILARATGGAMDGFLGDAAETAFGSGAKMFVAGGIQGGVFTPSSNDRSLLTGRLENAAVSGSTFAVMGAAGKALENAKLFGSNALLAKVSANGIAGGLGGVVEAYGKTYFANHRIANPEEVLKTAGQYALIGGGFGALDYGFSKGTKEVVLPVRDAYYRTKWAIRDGQTEAKRLTYSVLNKYDMRHPLQRVGNVIYGGDALPELPRPRLTEENNPIRIFETELPQYFRKIQDTESALDGIADRKDRYEIYEQQKQIKTDFALKLLNLWHGTAERPGIAAFSDGELATSNIPVERVADIRKALTLTAKSEYPEPSPLTQALADLTQTSIGGRAEETFGLSGELDIAKGQFFKYNERELCKRMSMPSNLHWKDNDYSTPLNWMPFEANEQLPNLFHGSVSNGLRSIFTERGMLSAREMRLRGIEQITGESADEEFPRRSISLTRDFTEAWAYHRHSPAFVTGYPVVFGVSADVIPRAWSAGLLEPGEILIDKLRLGETPLTRLGLRAPEITHIYVPDSQIPSVNRQLAVHRVTGIKVVGLNELKTPKWSELKTPEWNEDMEP